MAKRRTTSDDFDSPWKDALQRYFQAFLAFFFPAIHADVDWSRGYESLDKEFQRIARRANVGRGLADKLFKVWLKGGEECWLLVHVEVQGSYEREFPARMFQYNVAAFHVYNHEVVSLAVLSDENAGWRPTSFRYGRWGCHTSIEFGIAKLLDYGTDVEALERNDNPFAAVVLAHLQTLATRDDPQARKYWKLRIARGLYRQDWTAEDIRVLFHVIDWMMHLPDEFEEQFLVEHEEFEKEHAMPWLTTWERRARDEGQAEGKREGKIEGKLEGLWECIEFAMDVKFGRASRKLSPKVRAIKDLGTLRALKRSVKKAESMDDLSEFLDRSKP